MVASLRLETDRRAYKMKKREKDLSCSYCPPHRNENGHWRKPRKKKAFQLKSNRGFKRIKITSVI